MNDDYIGYCRVSSNNQKEDRQLIALTEYGVPLKQIFKDRQSGKNFERTNYKRMLKKLKKGKILVVKSIDRLGRNYEEIIEQWRYITKEIGADIIVLDMVLQLLSYVAENKRVNIKQRQAEGIVAAKAKGVRFGRPQTYNAEKYLPIYEQVKRREITPKQAMNKIGCCPSTYYRIISELKLLNRSV